MTDDWNPPPEFYDAMAKDCRCCRDCADVPCAGVCAGGLCDDVCRCSERDEWVEEDEPEEPDNAG